MPTSTSLSEFPQAYLITFHTYGSWLHGDAKGSVDRQHNRPNSELAPADPLRLATMQRRMSADALTLDQAQRSAVQMALAEVCAHRDWELKAINVRTNHVHVVIASPAKPEKVMWDLKAWATRKLRESGLMDTIQKVWSRHGSTRYLWDDQSIESACRYVTEGQGVDLT